MQTEREKDGKARVIAFYLPQFHPIPENDEWWGKGFTEWTNVVSAKPLFKGHVQPRIPTDLGFYDLRMPEIREQQVELAREAGLEGFCYYHYWFGDDVQLLERPFNEVVESGKPDFPFCLCWANHSWGNSTWTNVKGRSTKTMFVEQKYLGREDNEKHFYSLLKAFKDDRYITVDGKLLFLIYDPFNFKNVENFISDWRKLAKENGFTGFHFVGITNSTSFNTYLHKGLGKDTNDETDVSARIDEILSKGFDAVNTNSQYRAQIKSKGFWRVGLHSFLARNMGWKKPAVYNQRKVNKYMLLNADRAENVYPTIMPNWDRTPRNANEAVYVNSTPAVFKEIIERAVDYVKDKQDEHKLIIVKSWNEWGEGNYMEPDKQYGRGYIDAMNKVIKDEL